MDRCLPKEGRGVVLSGAGWEPSVQQGAEPEGLHQEQRTFRRCAVLPVGACGHAFRLGLQQQLPVEWAGRGSGGRHLPAARMEEQEAAAIEVKTRTGAEILKEHS